MHDDLVLDVIHRWRLAVAQIKDDESAYAAYGVLPGHTLSLLKACRERGIDGTSLEHLLTREVRKGEDGKLRQLVTLRPMEYAELIEALQVAAKTVDRLAAAVNDDAADDAKFSQEQGPSQWAKHYGFSLKTFHKRIEQGHIRVKKVSTRAYRVHVDDLPDKLRRS